MNQGKSVLCSFHQMNQLNFSFNPKSQYKRDELFKQLFLVSNVSNLLISINLVFS